MAPGGRPNPERLLSTELTPREREVLDQVAQGETNIEIGKALFISEETVRTHMTRIRRKMGAKSKAHAVAIGYQEGLLTIISPSK